MAAWIKFTDTSSVDPYYINLDQVYKITVDSGAYELTFYDANSILPTTYSFGDLTSLNTILKKLEVALSVLDLDSLAPQG